jgi:predicted RNA-binding Zn-ribbon protein involved in translation (DUF1610 family)
MENEQYPYQDEWDEYSFRKALIVLTFVIAMPLVIAAGLIFKTIFGDNREIIKNIVLVLFGVAAASIVFCVFRYVLWRCPRCKKYFRHEIWLDALSRRTESPTQCKNCGLPKYYGSSFFYDYWGTEQGDDLSRRIMEGKL